jgi:branched-chain amino acid transport system substrate-binding protein
MVNEQGGVNGRQINLVSLDDGYSPPKTVEQTRKLVENEQVFLLFGSVGTPTNTAIHKYVNSKKVPQIFIYSGANKWNDPERFPWTMAFPPNYQTEGHIYAKYVLQNIKDAKVGVLYQNDDYGKDFLTGFKKELGDQAAKLIVSEQSYETTDPTVDSQIVALKGSNANVFFNITTAKFAAQAIRKSSDIGWHPTQFVVSVAASIGAVFVPAGVDKAVGIISTAYLKDPVDPAWASDKGMQDFAAFMKKHVPDADLKDLNNVIGYTIAQATVHVLQQCGDDLTRENVMKQASNIKDLELPLLLPGIKMNTTPSSYFPINRAQLIRFDGKSWVRFGDVISG